MGPTDSSGTLSVSATAWRGSIFSAACDHANPGAVAYDHAKRAAFCDHATDAYDGHANDLYGDGYDDIYVGVRSRAQTRRPS